MQATTGVRTFDYPDLIGQLALPPIGSTSTSPSPPRRNSRSRLDPKRACCDGERTEHLTRLAGMWLGQKMPTDEVIQRCREWNSINRPPLSDDKLVATVESIAETHWRNHPEDDETRQVLTPLFDLASASAGRFVGNPPVRQWLLDDFLPLGKVGLVVAAGGTGKSMFALQLAMAIAAGCRFLHWDVGSPGSVLMLAAEDDDEELHRRQFEVIGSLGLSTQQWQIAYQRLFIKSIVAENNLMTSAVTGGEVEATDFVDRLLLTVAPLNDLRLIIIDPASRFRGGDENTAQDATRFVEQLERIPQATGATVLVLHHANKGAYNADEQHQGAARGSSALSDGVRWQLNLRVPTPQDAKTLALPEAKRKSYVLAANTKNNYAALADDVVLVRTPGGVLAPHHPRGQGPSIARQIYDFIQTEAARGVTYSAHGLEKEIGGVNGKSGIGKVKLRGIINDGISDGHWSKDANGNLVVGATPPQ